MFNKDFYPTPDNVIQKMLDQIDFKFKYGMTILDPSAGKGNILDYISNLSRYDTTNYICFEIEPELQSILTNKNYNLIGSDFLEELCYYSPDLIIMNPPFRNAQKHFLRAWELLKDGEIVCLMNAETYRNPNSFEKRKMVDIIQKNDGNIVELGSCFSQAERKTNVDTIMIHLKKESYAKEFYFNNESFEKENITIEEGFGNSTEIELTDLFMRKENRYKACIVAFEKLSKAVIQFKEIIEDIKSSSFYDEEIKNILWSGNINEFVKKFNGSAWEQILRESKFSTYLTKKVQDDFLSKFNNQKNISFSKVNMLQMFSILFENRTDILDKCLLEVFEYMTKFYHENRCEAEGWKTNDAYKVNKKVILPHVVGLTYSNKFEVKYNYRNDITDIDRALCYLTGKKIEHINTIQDSLEKQFDKIYNADVSSEYKKECTSTFFEIKFYKKGTIHLKFKDDIIWQMFNCKVSEMRGFPLPQAKDIESKFNNSVIII